MCISGVDEAQALRYWHSVSADCRQSNHFTRNQNKAAIDINATHTSARDGRSDKGAGGLTASQSGDNGKGLAALEERKRAHVSPRGNSHSDKTEKSCRIAFSGEDIQKPETGERSFLVWWMVLN